MTIDQAIAILQIQKKRMGGDAQLALALQPTFPVEYEVGIITGNNTTLYICEGSRKCILPTDVQKILKWGFE